MSERGKARPRGRRKHGLTDRMKALAASALAQKVGYLHMKDFPDTSIFDDLPTKSYAPNRIIRCKGELLLVRRGLVEVWHMRQDLLVKKLMIGVLFGEMPLLGQTMVVTQAVSGAAGATVAVMDADRVIELIKANAVSIAEKLYPRLASVEAGHYRATFQKADSRVAALLLELAGGGSTVEGYTQEDIADMVGGYRETATNVLGWMKAGKIIEIYRRKIVIRDKNALRAISEL